MKRCVIDDLTPNQITAERLVLFGHKLLHPANDEDEKSLYLLVVPQHRTSQFAYLI